LEVKPAVLAPHSDPGIAWAAANVLAWNALVPAERIRVAVSQGWITLEGAVDWRFQRTAAEDAVAGLAGVVGVTNLISISPSVPPEEVKEAIETALYRSAEVEARRIIVEVRGDCVTLWGTVDSWAQREAAEQAAWSAPGVRDVSNHVTVESGVAVA
jgi:osmotically-inducible protein OsmY